MESAKCTKTGHVMNGNLGVFLIVNLYLDSCYFPQWERRRVSGEFAIFIANSLFVFYNAPFLQKSCVINFKGRVVKRCFICI